MKRNIIYSILLGFIAVCVASCSLESDTIDGDGDFEGFWHLTSIETFATDSTAGAYSDLSGKRYFWAFQKDLLQLRDYDDGHRTLLCRFVIGDGRITLSDFTYSTEGRAHDVALPDSTAQSFLSPYGIPSTNPTYYYNISGGNMELVSDEVRLRLKKF